MQAELFLKLLELSPFTLEKNSNALFVNAQALGRLSGNLDCYQTKRGCYLKLQKLGANVYSAFPQKKYDLIIIYPSPAAEENYAHFAKAFEMLNPGGICLSAGDNKFGAKRFEDKLKLLFNNITSESKYKSRIFWAVKNESHNSAILNEWLELMQPQKIADSELYSQAGLFSQGQHDQASTLLLPYLQDLSGDVIDLGSGNGYLSYQALKQNQAIKSIHLAEHDFRALALSRLSLSKTTTVNLNFHWWDISESSLPEADFVISNPPYHSDFALDLKLLQNFISQGFKLLKRRGKFIFVTQKTFKVEAADLVFKNSQMLFSNNRYKIYQVIK